MIKRFSYLTLTFIVVLFLQGCAQKVELQPSVKNEINSIKVDRSILTPQLPFFMTGSDAVFIGLFGPIGGAVVGSDLSKEEKLAAHLKKSNIDIKEIYLDVLDKELKHSSFFNNKLSEENAKYILKSTILQYGLVYHHNILNSDYKPTMAIKMELIDTRSAKVIWSDTEFVTSYNNNTPQEELSKFLDDTELMKKALGNASKEVITPLLENFNK